MARLSRIEGARAAGVGRVSRAFMGRLQSRMVGGRGSGGPGAIQVIVSPPDTATTIKRIREIGDQAVEQADQIIEEETARALERIKAGWPTLLAPGWKEPTGFSRSRWQMMRGVRPRLDWMITNDASYAAYVHPPGTRKPLFESLVKPIVQRLRESIVTRLRQYLDKVRSTGTTQARIGGGANSGARSAVSRIRSLFGF